MTPLQKLDYPPAALKRELNKGYCPDIFIYNSVWESNFHEAEFLGEIEELLSGEDISARVLLLFPQKDLRN